MSKFVHDYCVYPSLFGALLYSGVPALRYGPWTNWSFVLAVIGLGVWLFGAIHDAEGLNTWQLHAGTDYNSWKLAPIAIAGVKRDHELDKNSPS